MHDDIENTSIKFWMFNFKIVYLAQFSTDFSSPDLKSKLGYALFKIEEILKLTLILWNSLIYTILKPEKWRHKPSQILYREYEPQASILCELWLGLWRHLHGFKIV